MSQRYLQQNVPTNLFQLTEFGMVYIKQYGAGNLRIAPDRESLEATSGPNQPIQDGIVVVTSEGFQQFFWRGDFWVISDQAGYIVFLTPGSSPFINRALSPEPQVPANNNLSTYQNFPRGLIRRRRK